MGRVFLFFAIAAISIGATGVSGRAEDTSELIAQLRSSDEAVRLHAIDVLGEHCWAPPEVLRALGDQLKSRSAVVRARAAHALGHLAAGARPVAGALAPLLRDPDAKVRRMAIRAWGRIRPNPAVSVPVLSGVLRDADPSMRTEALNILTEIGKPAVPTLVRLLQREDVVYWCCVALGEIGPDAAEAAPALVDVLNTNRQPEVRREAALALGAIGPSSSASVPGLIEALANRSPTVVAGAAYALGRIGPQARAAETPLTRCAANSDPLVKTVCAWALAKIDVDNDARKQAAITQLVTALKSHQPALRNAALFGLADLKPAPGAVLPAMREILHDPDKSVAGTALYAVSSFGDPAIPALTEALKRKELRPDAARILGQMGARASSATPALVEIVRTDENGRSRSEALMALGTTNADPKKVVPAAIEALQSRQEGVCSAACFSLGRMGSASAAAVPELLKKLGDRDECGAMAAWALVRIAPDSPEVARQLVPLFAKALDQCEAAVRIEAAASLARIGPLAKGAVPALRRASADSDKMVHAAALAALEAINTPLVGRK
jgi:HEAT repeat protein